jgi:N utilization substance protein A
MSAEIFEALSVLEKEKGIPVAFMLDKIRKSIATACKNSYDGNDDVILSMDQEKGVFEAFL